MFNKLSKIYPGWWLVLATDIIGFLGVGFTSLAFSVMFKPISTELGLSRTVTSIAASGQNVMGLVLYSLGGMSSDRYGPRRIMLIGIIIASIGCFLMYFINSLWAFLLVCGVVIGSGICLGYTFLTDNAIVNWFVRKSGLAINLKFAIQSMAGIILLPFIAWVTTSHGWRITYVIAGVALLLVCLPLTWIFVKPHRPEHYGLLPDGESPVKQAKTVGSRITEKALDSKLPEFTLKQTIKTPTYWIYIAVGCLGMFMSPMLYVHLVPFLTDRGIGLVQAASMMGIMNTISIPTRLVIGYAIDRVKTMNMRFIFTLGLVLQLAGVVLFLIFQNTFSIYLWLIFWGIGSGTNQSVSLPLLARFFGRKSYGVTKGLVNTIAVPFAILGPIYIGWIFDSTGTYMSFIILMTILLAFAGIISFFLLPPELPSRISEIGEVEN